MKSGYQTYFYFSTRPNKGLVLDVSQGKDMGQLIIANYHKGPNQYFSIVPA